PDPLPGRVLAALERGPQQRDRRRDVARGALERATALGDRRPDVAAHGRDHLQRDDHAIPMKHGRRTAPMGSQRGYPGEKPLIPTHREPARFLRLRAGTECGSIAAAIALEST